MIFDPSEAVRVLLEHVTDDAPADLLKSAQRIAESSDAVKRVGLDKPLVKSWRFEELREVREHGGYLLQPLGLFLDRTTGLFYARVPETEDGTLYAAETRAGLIEQVRPARRQWAEHLHQAEHKRQDTRVWERRIRICYSGGGRRAGRIGAPVTAKPTSASHEVGSYGNKPWDDPHDVRPCTEVGVLTYSRYERALQPDGQRYDLREWEEDFAARMARWEAARDSRHLTQERHAKSRPKRCYTRALVETREDRKVRKVRDLPWDPEVWERLHTLAEQFSALDAALLALFLQRLELRALPGPTD